MAPWRAAPQPPKPPRNRECRWLRQARASALRHVLPLFPRPHIRAAQVEAQPGEAAVPPARILPSEGRAPERTRLLAVAAVAATRTDSA